MTEIDGAQNGSVLKDDGRVTVDLGRVAVPKASDVLAEQLRQQILEGKLPEGAALPVERVLASSVGLARGTVRDALRVLEIEGLVETRPGRSGGSFVRRPDSATFERSLRVLVNGRGVRLQALLETREALEPAAARLAALRRTDADLESLERAATAMAESTGDIPRFLECNVAWHLAVGAASHNEIMEAIVNSLSRVILHSTEIPSFNSSETMAKTLDAHERILRAIRSGSADKAASAMDKHVHGYAELLRDYSVPDDVPL